MEKIEIELDKDEAQDPSVSYTQTEIENLSSDKVLDTILSANLFPLIRQRPFNKIASPIDSPRDIFISAINTAPLTVDLELVLKNKIEQFQAGITALTKLTKGNVYLCIKSNSILSEIRGAEKVNVSGPHPSGNVGIQIHKIKPINPGDIIWSINAQDVVVFGNLFLNGIYDPSKVITVAGPGATNPVHVKARTGISLQSLLYEHIDEEPVRIISGDVLTGRKVMKTGFIGFYDSTVSILPDTVEREFLGMLNPGNKKNRYSLSSAFMKLGNAAFRFNTSQNGSKRAVVPLNAWEKVLPMDIYPNELFRAILANDVEEMEQLGIWECDDEDFALCSFSCPSKIDVGAVIRQGLDIIEVEG